MKKKLIAVSIIAIVFCLGIVSINAAGRAKNKRNPQNCVYYDETVQKTQEQSQVSETQSQTAAQTSQQSSSNQSNQSVVNAQNTQCYYPDCPRLHDGSCNNSCNINYSTRHHNNSSKQTARQTNNPNNGHHNNGKHHR